MDDPLEPPVHMLTGDLPHVEAAIPGIEVNRLDRGRSEIELVATRLEDIGMCVARFDFKVMSEGGIDPDELRLGLQLDERGEGSWDGRSFGRDRVWVYPAGSEHCGAASPGSDGHGSTWATFSLRRTIFSDADTSDVAGRTKGPSVIAAETGSLRATIADVVAEVQQGTLTVDRARRAGRELSETTASTLTTADAGLPVGVSAFRLIERCLAVADDLDPIPTTAELAVALDVSDRWVRAAFDRVYAVPVSRFFRARALHRAHRLLMAAAPASTSVTEVAMECGFWHLGRFSGYYRAHFGEHPRNTLRRVP